MKNPQTSAEILFNIKNLDSIKKYGCCAFGCLWVLHLDPTDIEAIKILDDAINEGVIEKDCTVHWIEFFEWLSGKKIEVEFKNISSIKSITKRTLVRYDYNGRSHWVGVENGEIKYNSLKNSVCVAMGKPVTARIIKFNGVQI